MPEVEKPRGDMQQELDALMSAAESKEQASRKRTFLYTLLPIIAGLIFLGVSLYKVSRLQRTANGLNVQIEAQKGEVAAKRKEIETLEEERKQAEADLALTTAALSDIDKGKGDPKQKARQTLALISRDSKRSNLSSQALRSYELALESYKESKPDNKEAERVLSEALKTLSVTVPNVIGKSYADARALLDSVGLVMEANSQAPKNIVIKQTPDPGTKVVKGDKVHLWFKSVQD